MGARARHLLVVLACVGLFTSCLHAYELRDNEGTNRLGIQLGWLNHSAGQSKFDSTHAMFWYERDSIYQSGWAWGMNLGFGASVGDINGTPPLAGTEALSTAPVRGGVGIVMDTAVSAGYYFITRTHDRPLYLGTGLRYYEYTYSYGNTPVYASLVGLYLPIELRGDYALNHTTSLEYLLAYDMPLGMGGSIFPSGSSQAQSLIMQGSGNTLRLMLGLRYYVGKSSFFYAQLHAQVANFAKSESVTITNNANADTPGLIQGASASVYYPKSRTSFVGVRLGFGF